METNWPSSLPQAHRAFLVSALERLARDERLVGIAAAGSFATDSMDEFSDIDLILAVEPEASKVIMSDRRSIVASLGPLLSAFTGEHVGE